MSGHASAIDPSTIAAQRAAGWPDFHPEDYCHECGRRNPTWSVDSALWNLTRTDNYVTIRCPACFAIAWEKLAGARIIWRLVPDMDTGVIRRGELSPEALSALADGVAP